MFLDLDVHIYSKIIMHGDSSGCKERTVITWSSSTCALNTICETRHWVVRAFIQHTRTFYSNISTAMNVLSRYVHAGRSTPYHPDRGCWYSCLSIIWWYHALISIKCWDNHIFVAWLINDRAMLALILCQNLGKPRQAGIRASAMASISIWAQ